MGNYQEYSRLKKLKFINNAIVLTIISVLVIWAYTSADVNLMVFVVGFKNILSFIFLDLLPPDFSNAQVYLMPILETLYMSYIAAIFSIIMSVVMGILAADNISPHPFIASVARGIIGFIRAVPTLVLALFLVATFGIGMFAGIIAIAIGGVGTLGKAYADNIQEVDEGQMEAIRATGANWFQVLGQGVWPQFKPSFIAWSFYNFDTNIRSASVIGLIGAGGIGFYLNTSIKLFQYREAAFGIMLIFILIMVVEHFTAKLRKQVL